MIEWKLEKCDNGNGQQIDTLVKYTDGVREECGTVDEFVRLFEACSKRWEKYGWDLDKVIQCIAECEFD